MKFFRLKKLLFLLFLLGGVFYLFLVYPFLSSYFKYRAIAGSGLIYSLKSQKDIEAGETVIKPVSRIFGLVITKLGLNQKVIKEVDYYDAEKLKTELKKGLAHVKTSALPGEFGAVLIVGHPLDSFFNFTHLNPDFYLINKLEVGDEISLFYNDLEYSYQVSKKYLAPPTFLDFFEAGEERKLMLVSGYPPGMALKFSVVEAEEIY